MRVLVTGISGQLGYDCVKELKNRGYTNIIGVSSKDFDITDKTAVIQYVKSYNPNVIIHCAAFTNVDAAEKNPDTCFAVNTLGTKTIVDICKEDNIKLIFISTDFVFDGCNNVVLTEDADTSPLNIYGKSKQLAEKYVIENLTNYFIVRTSWLYGINGNNFVKAMLNLAKAGYKELEVVADQYGAPTFTEDLSKLLCDMVNSDKYGIYQATNEGYISKADFAKAIFKLDNINMVVNNISTDEYNTKHNIATIRPQYSNLSKDKLVANGFSKLPNWEDALKRYIEELNNV